MTIADELTIDSDASDVFIALVGGIGANFKAAVQHISDVLQNIYRFEVHHVRVSSLLKQFKPYENLDREHYEGDLERYYKDAIDAGNRVRDILGDGAALARMAMESIEEERKRCGKRRAFIIDSLKRPEELHELRQVYGLLFYCIAIYADSSERERRLAGEFSEAISSSERSAQKRLEAARLVARDNGENIKFGQAVRKTFQEADYFVRTDEGGEFSDALQRAVDLILNKQFVSPTRSEVAMMHAFTAALRSADLSRQVGAAIVSRTTRILATGCNEVPSPGGGQYWNGDPDDARDFVRGRDENDRLKERAILELLQVLATYAVLDANKQAEGLPKIYKELQAKHAFADTRLDSLIEFGRIVHAENAAITEAAYGGTGISDTDLYCTTFPCHMCARVIIAAGIRNVFYIEPYPKSAVAELYSDQIVVNPPLPTSEYNSRLTLDRRVDRRVYFIPFEGVAPRRYRDLFSHGMQKDEHGIAAPFDPMSKPRNAPRIATYLAAEAVLVKKLKLAVLAHRAELDEQPSAES